MAQKRSDVESTGGVYYLFLMSHVGYSQHRHPSRMLTAGSHTLHVIWAHGAVIGQTSVVNKWTHKHQTGGF